MPIKASIFVVFGVDEVLHVANFSIQIKISWSNFLHDLNERRGRSVFRE
jgi:hypothetical protein